VYRALPDDDDDNEDWFDGMAGGDDNTDPDDDDERFDGGEPGTSWDDGGSSLCFRSASDPVVVSDKRRWMYWTRRWSAARISMWDDGTSPFSLASGEHGPCLCTTGILVPVAAAPGMPPAFSNRYY